MKIKQANSYIDYLYKPKRSVFHLYWRHHERHKPFFETFAPDGASRGFYLQQLCYEI